MGYFNSLAILIRTTMTIRGRVPTILGAVNAASLALWSLRKICILNPIDCSYRRTLSLKLHSHLLFANSRFVPTYGNTSKCLMFENGRLPFLAGLLTGSERDSEVEIEPMGLKN